MERSPIPEPVRRRLHSLSQTVFTRDRREEAAAAEQEERPLRCVPGQLIVSSLPLQMCLYFNFYFYPFWWVCEIIMLHLKYGALNTYYRIVLSALLILMTIVEVIRLYLGYMGNLQEKVPELAGFWLLTLLLQIPMTLFHTCSPRLILLPLERGTSIVYLLFLLAEVLLAFATLRHMVKQLEMRFHLTHFDSLEQARRPWGHPDSERFPGGSVAGERFPGGSVAGERFPGGSVAGERFPGGSVAGERFPGGSVAGERFPGGSTLGQRFPGASTDDEGPTDHGGMSLRTIAGHSGRETVSVLQLPGGDH